MSPRLTSRSLDRSLRPHLHQVIKKRRPAPHVGEGRRRRAIDVATARRELVPVDAGGDGHAGANALGERDPGLKPAAVVVDLGPLARRSSPRLRASSADSSIVGSPAAAAMAGRVGERRVEELGPRRAEQLQADNAPPGPGASAGLRAAGCRSAAGRGHRPSSARNRARTCPTGSGRRRRQTGRNARGC